MHQLSTPERRFAELLRTDPSRPFVTYYDEASGERSELSVKSLANWVAKTHYLLTDELGLGVGDTAVVALPPHWISVPVLLGCLTAGLSLAPDDGDVAFLAPQTIGVAAGVPDRYVIAPDSAAVGLRSDVPDGAHDYVAAVRPQPDAWSGVAMPAGPDDPCMPGHTRAGVAAAAAEHATSLGLGAGGRLLSSRDWTSPDDWIITVLAPLSAGGSVVLVRNADDATLTHRAAQERASASDSPGSGLV